MWICASCGTQAKQIELCSGCGVVMRSLDPPPPPPKKYQFMLVVTFEDKTMAAFGPFESVMAADTWQDEHFKRVTSQVMLMTHPDEST
jgi:hypothetical protein